MFPIIGLVNLRAPRRIDGCEELLKLPTSPALRWSGFLVRTTRDLGLADVVPWAAEMRSRRPFVAIGLVPEVGPDESALFEALAHIGMRFDPIIVAHGIRGGMAYSLKATGADGAPLSESTVRRRLKKAGLPALARLLRDVRLRGVRLRVQLGADKGDAVIAAGFSSVKAFEKAARRSG